MKSAQRQNFTNNANSPKQLVKLISPDKLIKKTNSNSVHSTPKDENRPPPTLLKQKPLTFYFGQKSKGNEEEAIPVKPVDIVCSPTPIKKAKPAIGNRIESPSESGIVKNNAKINCDSKNGSQEITKKPIWREAAPKEQLMNEDDPPPDPDYAELSKKRVKRLNKRLKNALNDLDRENFSREMKSAALLNDEQIGTIPNELIRYLVKKGASKHKMELAIRSMTMEKRKNYRREITKERANSTNSNFDNLYTEFLAGKYEDSYLASLAENEGNKIQQKSIPQFTQIFPSRSDLGQQFGRALGICQFFNIHHKFFHLIKWRISATKLLTTIGDGQRKEVQSIFVDSMLAILVNFLTTGKKTAKPKVEVQERCLRSRDIKTAVKPEPNATLISSLKNLLQKEQKEGNIQIEQFVGLSTALSELDVSSRYQFFCFNVEGQLSLLENLISQIVSSESFHNYMESDGANELAENEKEQNELGEEMTKLREELKKLEEELTNLGDLSILTRKQMADISKNEQRKIKIVRELEDLEDQLTEAKRNKRLLEFTSRYRIQPLGQDRFHRNYWFFADSPDGNTIFVQQQVCPFPNCPWLSASTNKNGEEKMEEQKENEEIIMVKKVDGDDEECKFVEQIQWKIMGRPCSVEREERWWKIEKATEFNGLIEILMGRGRREHQLKRTLLAYKDLILEKLKPGEPMEAEKEDIFDAQRQ